MPAWTERLERAAARPGALSRDELARLAALRPGPERDAVLRAAYGVKLRQTGPVVYLRGLVEIGNRCSKNCLYCGLRRDNARIHRYQIDEDGVVRMARRAWDLRYGSVVLQSGEIASPANTGRIERIVRAIRAFAPEEAFAIVLSLGEQAEETYRRWKEAGATRYLLRIETSNPALYRTLHPDGGHDWAARRDCLRALRRLGYQTGSGVMIGLPGQTAEDLADDLLFFRDEEIDMIGMGPFLPHPDTPLGSVRVDETRQLELGVNLVAALRLFLHDRNIAATTALQNLAPDGREQALLAGANVMMPNITDMPFRRDYQLYQKPCVDEISPLDDGSGLSGIEKRVRSIGESIAWDTPGTPPHFLRRTAAAATP
ncbi:MAG: [FeFe] hydrogenase H-cluster radical SAM maturase HydE [Kiritimatiellia bacterium]|jgi:biotin synthase